MEDSEPRHRLRDAQTLPARLQNRLSLPQHFQGLPDRFPKTRSRSSSGSSDTAATAVFPPQSLSRAPPLSDPSFNHDLAALATRILYRSGTDPVSGGPLLILCAYAFPDAQEVDYNKLLPYVLAQIPSDEELGGLEDGGVGSGGYSVVFFAGGSGEKKGEKSNRPNWGWTLQAYHLLGRAVRKKIRRLWVVHERAWVRVLFEMMAGVVSVKFRKKIIHLNTLTDLAMHIEITKIVIPPAVYLHNRKVEPTITMPGFPKAPIFGRSPFHHSDNPPRIGDNTPLPQVLLDTTSYITRHCLDVEGLFRVPPSQAYLEIIRDAYDRRQALHWEDYGPHVAAGIVKLYYRSLPDPVIPIGCYPEMLSLAPSQKSSDESDYEAFETVRTLLTYESHQLPSTSRILLLRHLLPLLSLVASHSAHNKMTPQNLAVCVAGSLARSDDPMADAKASAGVRRFIEIGIERIEELAPRLPLRRGAGGIAHADKRRSMASIASVDSGIGINFSRPITPPTPGKPSAVRRKGLPQLATASWENVDRKTALTRKPLPFEGSSPSDKTHSPANMSPAESAFAKAEMQVITGGSAPPAQRATMHLPVAGEKPPARVDSAKKALSTPLPGVSIQPSPPLLPPPPKKAADGRKLSLPDTPGPRPLRRVASANFPSHSSTAPVGSLVAQRRRSFLQEGKDSLPTPPPPIERPVLRKIKSAAVAGGVVAELSKLYEERAMSAEVLARVKGSGSGRS